MYDSSEQLFRGEVEKFSNASRAFYEMASREPVHKLLTPLPSQKVLDATADLVRMHLGMVDKNARYNFERPPDPPARSYLEDTVRTGTMLIALSKGIQRVEARGATSILLDELGCGTGFFVCTSASMHKKVHAIGYELDPEAVRASHMATGCFNLARDYDLGRRAAIQRRDLKKAPLQKSAADIVVHEHMVAGALTEDPNGFAKSSTWEKTPLFIPAHVVPVIALEHGQTFNSYELLGTSIIHATPGKRLDILRSSEVVIGSAQTAERVEINQKVEVEPGLTLLQFGMDVTWLEGSSITTTCRNNWEAARQNAINDGSILGPVAILFPMSNGGKKRLGIANETKEPQAVMIRASYPLGGLASKTGELNDFLLDIEGEQTEEVVVHF